MMHLDLGTMQDLLKAFTTPQDKESFWGDKSYLSEYIHKSKTVKHTTTGHGYYGKLDPFIKHHNFMEVGELYIEFINEGCNEKKGEVCR